jgi:hypothetical protein
MNGRGSFVSETQERSSASNARKIKIKRKGKLLRNKPKPNFLNK